MPGEFGELAYRMARAVYRRAKKSGKREDVLAELNAAVALVSSDPAVRVFLNHPRIGIEEKRRILSSAAHSALSKKLIDVVLGLKDINLLREVRESFENLLKGDSDRVYAEAWLPAGSGPAEKKALEEAVAKATGRKAWVETNHDPEIIGGVRLKMEGTVIDATLNAELRRIRERLTS